MLISSDVSNTCLFAPAPYYKLNKGYFLGFLFKQESLGKVSFIYYLHFNSNALFKVVESLNDLKDSFIFSIFLCVRI